MPFVLAPEFAAVAAAFLLALLCVAVAYLLTAIAKALPKVNLGVIVIDFGKIFLAIVSPAVSLLTDAAVGLFHFAEAWLRAIGWLLTEMFDGIKDVLGLHAAQISHVYGTVVPQSAATVKKESAAYANSTAATLTREIAAARTNFDHLAAADEAAEYAKAEKLVGGVRHELTAVASKSVSTSEAYTNKQIAALRKAIATDIAGARAYTDAQVGALGKELEGQLTIPVAAPGLSIGTVEGIATGAVAAVGTAVATLTSEFESCAVTTCAGPNNLENLLSKLLGGIALVDLGVFLDKVINDPSGAIAEYEGEVEGLYNTVKAGGTDVWSAIEAVLGL